MKKYNLGMSVILIVISTAMLKQSNTYGSAAKGTAMGSGVWPGILAVAMMILACVLAVETLVQKRDEKETEPIQFCSFGMKRIYVLAGICLVFAVLLQLLGFFPSMIFLVPGVMLLLGEKRPAMLAALTLGILIFVQVVFVMLLGLKLPIGLLFK